MINSLLEKIFIHEIYLFLNEIKGNKRQKQNINSIIIVK
jgi:hypothetical protein